MNSCVTSNQDLKKRPVDNKFYWNSVYTNSNMWEVILPKTQKYIITIVLNNTSNDKQKLELSTDQGHMERVNILENVKNHSVILEFDIMMAGKLILKLENLSKKLEILSISISDRYHLSNKKLELNPINKNSIQEVYDLLAFLGSVYGKGILSGQMDLTWDDTIDMESRVEKFTGQKPSIFGYDFMNYKGFENGGSGLKQVEEATRYSNLGGIITFCWHWRVGKENKFYSKETNFRINRNPESIEFKVLIEDIDKISLELKKLKKHNIPVLWRPLHEASGGWFWWGASGPEDYLFLWDLIYDRMTYYHKLNNLIWVWNGQDKLWYPGDNKVDIIGVDIYKGRGDHSSLIEEFIKAQNYVDGDFMKLIALTENGSIPDPNKLQDEGVPWSWFMTWNDNNKNSSEDFFSSNEWTSHGNKRSFYNHPYVINLDKINVLR